MTPATIVLVLLAALCPGQDSAPKVLSFEQLSASAQQAWEAGRQSEATDLFTRATAVRPDWTEGWWALGTLHYEANRYEECRSALERMVKLDDKAAPGWALLGLCEFETKRYEPSFQHLKRAHILVPPGNSGQLLDIADYHLGLLLTRQGAFELSHEILLRVAQHLKASPEIVFACGLPSLRIAALPGDVPPDQQDPVRLAGKTFWDLATQHPSDVEADFAALMAKYSSFPNVHYFYGTYLAVHRPEAATPEFLAELKINPDSVPARVQLTLRYLLEQRLDEALKFAREAVKLSPDSVGAQLALGRALRATGDDQGALAAFLEAKRLDPVSPEIRLYLVAAFRALGRPEQMRREQAEHDRLKASQSNWP